MKRVLMIALVALVTLCLYGNASAQTHIQEAVKESAKASSAASKGSVHAIAASGQATSAVSAAPLLISGAAGAVSGKVGSDLMQSATQPIGQPLEVTDEAITAGPPPDQVLKIKKNE